MNLKWFRSSIQFRGIQNLIGMAAVLMMLSFGASVEAGYFQGFESNNFQPFSTGGSPNPLDWYTVNNSTDANQNFPWIKADPMMNLFSAQSGNAYSYYNANYASTSTFASNATISNWLLTPEFSWSNGDSFSFWTRTAGSTTDPNQPSQYPDRLELRISANGSSVDVGNSPTSVGDFSTLLLDINPTYAQTTLTSTGLDGYPINWTKYTVTLSVNSNGTVMAFDPLMVDQGTPGANFSGRLAFRYFVQDTALNGNLVALDTFGATANVVPEPASYVMIGIGLSAFALFRSRRRILS
jgi:hypothetical protein